MIRKAMNLRGAHRRQGRQVDAVSQRYHRHRPVASWFDDPHRVATTTGRKAA